MAKNGKRLGFLPGWRKGTYIILIFNLIMLAWVIGGAASASHVSANECGGLDQQTCQSAADAGTAIGVGILIFFWALGDLILGVIWLVTNRKKTRECPACGSDVKKGLFACRRCGFDFRSTVQPMPQSQPFQQQAVVRPAFTQMQTVEPKHVVPPQRVPQPVTASVIREWAREHGHAVNDKGPIPAQLRNAYLQSVG